MNKLFRIYFKFLVVKRWQHIYCHFGQNPDLEPGPGKKNRPDPQHCLQVTLKIIHCMFPVRHAMIFVTTRKIDDMTDSVAEPELEPEPDPVEQQLFAGSGVKVF
jgi:hypothetical protein